MYGIILDNRLIATSDDKLTKEVTDQYMSSEEEKYLVVNMPETTIEEMLLQCMVPVVLLDIVQRTRQEAGLPFFEDAALSNINAILANIAYLNFTATVLNIPGGMEAQLIAFVGEYEAWKDTMMQQLVNCSAEQLNTGISLVMEEIGHFIQLLNILRSYGNNTIADQGVVDNIATAYVADDDSYGIMDFSGALSEVLSGGLPDTNSIN